MTDGFVFGIECQILGWISSRHLLEFNVQCTESQQDLVESAMCRLCDICSNSQRRKMVFYSRIIQDFLDTKPPFKFTNSGPNERIPEKRVLDNGYHLLHLLTCRAITCRNDLTVLHRFCCINSNDVLKCLS